MRKYIEIYINVFIYRRFSSICRFLGVKVCDVLEDFMRKFIEEHKDQAPLDLYLNQGNGKTQIINFNFTQNNYNIILAKIAKLDPQRWLEDLERFDPEKADDRELEFFKQKLPELILEASKALEDAKLAGEYEYAEILQELIDRASEALRKLLRKKKSRRELIHA